jgi:hypothetical protein
MNWETDTKFNNIRLKRLAFLFVCLGLFCYISGFILNYPSVFASMDASIYVSQAWAYSQGSTSISVKDLFSNDHKAVFPGTYPAGTALLQVPFILLGGERGAVLASIMSLTASILILCKWMINEGCTPIYALLMLGYAPTLIMSRCETSLDSHGRDTA